MVMTAVVEVHLRPSPHGDTQQCGFLTDCLCFCKTSGIIKVNLINNNLLHTPKEGTFRFRGT